jgi:hypothetical protein
MAVVITGFVKYMDSRDAPNTGPANFFQPQTHPENPVPGEKIANLFALFAVPHLS